MNNNEGWAIGEDGTILRTANGGRQHGLRQNSTVTVDLKAMSFLNAQLGWIGLPDGVLKTTNGGATWSRTGTGISGQVQDIQFLDANTGLLVTKLVHAWAEKSSAAQMAALRGKMSPASMWGFVVCDIWALHIPNQISDRQWAVSSDLGTCNTGWWPHLATPGRPQFNICRISSPSFLSIPSHGWAFEPAPFKLLRRPTADRTGQLCRRPTILMACTSHLPTMAFSGGGTVFGARTMEVRPGAIR